MNVLSSTVNHCRCIKLATWLSGLVIIGPCWCYLVLGTGIWIMPLRWLPGFLMFLMNYAFDNNPEYPFVGQPRRQAIRPTALRLLLQRDRQARFLSIHRRPLLQPHRLLF